MIPRSRWRAWSDRLLAGGLATLALLELGRAGLLFTEPASALFALGATAPLAYRRQLPLGSFLVVWGALQTGLASGLGLGEDMPTFLLVFVVALYSLGAHTRGWAGWVGGLLVGSGMVLFIVTDPGPFSAGDVPFAMIVVGGPWAVGLAVRLRRDRERALIAVNDGLQREQEERARAAVAEERARIARELHDVVSHAISVTVLQARGGRRVLAADPSAAREAFDVIERTNAQALGDMRRLLTVLRESDEELAHVPQPSLGSLTDLVDQMRGSGLEIALRVEGNFGGVPPGVDLSAYRIVQEALTNVLKHAPQSRCTVTVGYGDIAVELVVEDDGHGGVEVPPHRAQGGHGLIGVQERVAVAGGALEAGPTPAGGFRVRARLPYEVPA